MDAAPLKGGTRSHLPPAFRIAATARRVLGARGMRTVYGSTLAAPIRRVLRSAAPSGLSLVDVCGGQLAGAKMHLDLSCEKFYWLGTHEEAVQNVIVNRVRSGDVVYDIGAHVGFFSLVLSRLVGDSGRVLAFEPDAPNVARLAANIAVNGRSNVDVHAVALGDACGTQQFATSSSSLMGTLIEPHADHIASASVPVTTIDAVVARGAAPPALMKIDVEGAEGRVVARARQTILSHRPAMLLEIHSPSAWGELLDALPLPYAFTDVEATAYRPGLRMPGHYLAVPAPFGGGA